MIRRIPSPSAWWLVAIHVVAAVVAWLVARGLAPVLPVTSLGLGELLAIGSFIAVGAPLLYLLAFRPMAARLLQESGRVAALLEAAPEGILAVDAEGSIRMVNTQLLRQFGYEARDLLGRPVEILVPGRLAGTHVALRQSAAGRLDRRAMGTREDLVGRRSDGSEFAVDVSLSAFDEGPARLRLAVIRDATQQRRAAREAREANDQLRTSLLALEQREELLRRLGTMGELLQGAESEAEAMKIVAAHGENLFWGYSGGVYLISPSRNVMELASRFGSEALSLPVVAHPGSCWALRRGRLHRSRHGDLGAWCAHNTRGFDTTICMPLVAHGETLASCTSRNRRTSEPRARAHRATWIARYSWPRSRSACRSPTSDCGRRCATNRCGTRSPGCTTDATWKSGSKAR